MKLGIAIPTYNEAGNISKLVDEIYANINHITKLKTTLLVIDDSSPDNTANFVNKLTKKYAAKKNFEVVLLSRKIKNGLGQAYLDGFKYLLGLNVDCILQMDADLSHNPVYIPLFIEAAKEYDLVIGTRYIDGGQTPDWALSRRFLSRSGNLYTRLILGKNISDYTGGYNLYSSSLLRKIKLSSIKSTGYGFLIELKYKSSKVANNIYQIPIVFNDRLHGKSKIPKNTIIKNLFLVPRLRKIK